MAKDCHSVPWVAIDYHSCHLDRHLDYDGLPSIATDGSCRSTDYDGLTSIATDGSCKVY